VIFEFPRTLVALAAAVALAVAGCSSSQSAPVASSSLSRVALSAASARAATAANPSSAWPTYHASVSRSGDAGPLVPALSGALRRGWSAHLDGAVYAEPIIIGSTGIVATEHDTAYALSLKTGKIVWARHFGTPVPTSALPCGNINPLGITGTPAFDQASGLIFVVTETTGAVHTLWALAAGSGAVRWHRNLDVTRRDRHAEQERAAVLVVGKRVIVAFGGLYGDCGNYIGYVTATATSGRGSTAVYAVPSAREAGSWAPAGPVEGPGGRIYLSLGNGAATTGSWDGSDSVIALDPTTLRRVAAFAPTSWPADNANDLDLGSSSPVPVMGKILITGKRGTAYLLAPSLGGAHQIGGQLASRRVCSAYGGAAFRGADVYLPCTTGLRKLTIGAHSISNGWQAAGIPGSPVLAGNMAYVLRPSTWTFYELALNTGRVVRSLSVGGRCSRFATPTVVSGHAVLVPTNTGVVEIL